MIYYFLPVSVNNALYSHQLSLLGFWSLALVYPFVGTHHYLFSPIPYWTQTISIVTSMLLIIPVWTVTVNFFGTMIGRWGAVLGNLPEAQRSFRGQDACLVHLDVRKLHGRRARGHDHVSSLHAFGGPVR